MRDIGPPYSGTAPLLILSEIGDVTRFPDSRHLCSYAGLVPSVHASGGKTRLGRLTKHGSKWLRWILVEASTHAIHGAPQFRSLYHRVVKKHGRNTGRVAVARAMLKTIYAMLTKQEPFRPMVKRTTGQRQGSWPASPAGLVRPESLIARPVSYLLVCRGARIGD